MIGANHPTVEINATLLREWAWRGVELELEGGHRLDVKIDPAAERAVLLRSGDIGIATIRDGRLMDFAPVA